MIQNNNLSILPFYSNIKYQNSRKSYSYGDIYPLYSPNDRFLPFQIIRPNRTNGDIQKVYLYDSKNVMLGDITNDVLYNNPFFIKEFPEFGYDVIYYPAVIPINIKLEQGIKYISVFDGFQWYYSEMFTVIPNTSPYLCIEYWDVDNLVFDGGQIVYDDSYKNRIYLCAELGKPEYKFEEDGEDRDGYFFPEKQLSEKTYHFQFLAPEFLCDAMRIIRMSDFVKVYFDGLTYDCDTFLITPKWQTQGNLASVEVEFETATVIKKIGRGFIISNRGDFNKSFNNDFNVD